MIADAMKKCTRCGETKPVDAFYWHNKEHTRRSAKCKMCTCAHAATRKRKPWRKRFVCSECGEATSGRQTGLCCECYRIRIAKEKQERQREADQSRSVVKPIILRACVECGLATHRKKFCSEQCNWRAQRRIRRARKRHVADEVVELGQVASRDGWVCQLCGKRVRKQSVYHKQATLDHIIPLSRGGRHNYQNCQLAHFDCNSSKHSKMGGQQRLFG